jgi:uncharacterized radical SAM superfamily protein
MEPSYRIRYRPTASFGEGYTYIDVIGSNLSSYTITGLAKATDYTISIMSFNKLGSSKYLPDTLRAKTSSKYLERIFHLYASPNVTIAVRTRKILWEGNVVYVRKNISGHTQLILELISSYGASHNVNHTPVHSEDINRVKLSLDKFQWQLVWT